MVDQANTQEDKKHQESSPFYNASRRLLLAAIGAMAIAQDEAEDFVNHLVERGEIAEKDGKRLVSEIIEKRKINKHDFEAASSKHIHETLERLNIPTKNDIDELSEKVAVLTRKVEEFLSKE
jgi:polyhydroxyalkanoate synthesis regulator phasin